MAKIMNDEQRPKEVLSEVEGRTTNDERRTTNSG